MLGGLEEAGLRPRHSRRILGQCLLALITVACGPPGGGVKGHVLDQAGAPVPDARLKLTSRALIGEGASIDGHPNDSGWFLVMWSHGSWQSTQIEASAPGFRKATANLGWGYWDCEFRLAHESSPASSAAVCKSDDDSP